MDLSDHKKMQTDRFIEFEMDVAIHTITLQQTLQLESKDIKYEHILNVACAYLSDCLSKQFI